MKRKFLTILLIALASLCPCPAASAETTCLLPVLNACDPTTEIYKNAWVPIWAKNDILCKLQGESLDELRKALQAQPFIYYGLYDIIQKENQRDADALMLLSLSPHRLALCWLQDKGHGLQLIAHDILVRSEHPCSVYQDILIRPAEEEQTCPKAAPVYPPASAGMGANGAPPL